MSNMKCPVCNKGTVTEFETAPYFACSNEFCPSYSETDTTEYDILIRTRKALNLALAELHEIDGVCDDNKYTDNLYVGLDGQDTRNIARDVKKTITQITALTKGDDNE